MFSLEQLHERMFDLMKPRNVVAVEATTFDAEQFESVGSEQRIAVHRVPTSVTADPVSFWVSSVASLDWWQGRGSGGHRSRYIKGSLCRYLTESQFDGRVAGLVGGLARPIRLPLHRSSGGFVGAMLMSDEWNDVSVLAAYTDELIAFYWSTSA